MPRNATASASSDLLNPLEALVQESRANRDRLGKRLREGKLSPDQLAPELVDTVMSLLTDGLERVLLTLSEFENWADGVDEDVGGLLAASDADGDEPALLPEQAAELKSLLMALLNEVPSTSEVRGALEVRVDKQMHFLDEITMSEESEETDEEDAEEESDDDEPSSTDSAAN